MHELKTVVVLVDLEPQRDKVVSHLVPYLVTHPTRNLQSISEFPHNLDQLQMLCI